MQKKLEGKKCPSFKGETTGNTTVSEKDFIGKNLVIFFYPKIVLQAVQPKVKTLETVIKIFKSLIQK